MKSSGRIGLGSMGQGRYLHMDRVTPSVAFPTLNIAPQQKLQEARCIAAMRLVGGRCHNLSVLKTATHHRTTSQYRAGLHGHRIQTQIGRDMLVPSISVDDPKRVPEALMLQNARHTAEWRTQMGGIRDSDITSSALMEPSSGLARCTSETTPSGSGTTKHCPDWRPIWCAFGWPRSSRSSFTILTLFRNRRQLD